MKRIKPNELPQPWELSAEWLTRLGIKEAKVRRSYLSLRVPERKIVEDARLLFIHYQTIGIGRKKTLPSLIKELSQHFDQHWLAPGQGRAVDMKRTLEVLEVYAHYCGWAETIAHCGGTLMDIVCPYWIDETANLKYGGQGAVRLIVQMRDPKIGNLHDVQWGYLMIWITEGADVQWPETQQLPFLLKTSDSIKERWTESFSRKQDTKARGLVGRFHLELSQALTVPNFPMTQENLDSDWFAPWHPRFHYILKKPAVAQVSAFLSVFAEFYNRHHHPEQDQWELQFSVSNDLTAISHSCQLV